MSNVHAGCVLVGEAGVLIRGPSGSGKSTLARLLIEAAQHRGLFARLVSDDRTHLTVQAGRLIARPVAPLEGLIEMRGLGLKAVPHEAGAIIRLVVDCGSAAERLPEAAALQTSIQGIFLSKVAVEVSGNPAELVLSHLRDLMSRA